MLVSKKKLLALENLLFSSNLDQVYSVLPKKN